MGNGDLVFKEFQFGKTKKKFWRRMVVVAVPLLNAPELTIHLKVIKMLNFVDVSRMFRRLCYVRMFISK